MKPGPLSLTAQLTVLLLAGIFAAHLIALLLNARDYGEMHPIARNQAIERVIIAQRLLQTCRQCDRQLLLAPFNHARQRFSVRPDNPLAGRMMNEDEQELATLFASQGGFPLDAVFVFEGWKQPGSQQATSADATALITAVALDNQWLMAIQYPLIRMNWWRPLMFSLPVSILPVLLVVLLFARRLLRPLRDLEQATTCMSQGDNGEPLPERGPRELRKLIRAFNEMRENLAGHIRDKTCMLATISHDLRTPITSLRLRVELLEDDSNKRGMLQTLAQLQNMVNEALAFLRDDTSQETRQTVDLAHLLDDIAAQRRAIGQPVNFAGAPACPVSAYSLALTRAVDNLLDNALRYGSMAQISLSAPGTHVTIQIQDNGPGIPDEWLERVFRPFVRIDKHRNSGHHGVGLGLSIVRSCIQRHGGVVHLQNHAGGGLLAIIQLPIPAHG